MPGKITIALKVQMTDLLGPLLKQLLALQQFCEKNELPFPPPELQEVLGNSYEQISNNGHSPNRPSPKRGPDKNLRAVYTRKPKPFVFKMPERPDYGPVPDGVGPNAKGVPLPGAAGLNIVLCILEEEGGGASSSTINARLSMLRPGSGISTASMTLHSLKDEGKITGDFRMWRLVQRVPIKIVGQRMWCAVEQLRQQDRAALRREVILAALKVNPRMTVAEISECLRRCEWLSGVTVEPDQVKGNLRVMGDEGLVEREGPFWKLKA